MQNIHERVYSTVAYSHRLFMVWPMGDKCKYILSQHCINHKLFISLAMHYLSWSKQTGRANALEMGDISSEISPSAMKEEEQSILVSNPHPHISPLNGIPLRFCSKMVFIFFYMVFWLIMPHFRHYTGVMVFIGSFPHSCHCQINTKQESL